MKTVSDILQTKAAPYNIIGPNEMVIDGLQLLSITNLSYLIVMEGEKFCGIFSERDYSRNVALKNKTSATCPIHEAMSTDMPYVDPDDSVEKCIHLILDHKTRYLPVVKEHHFAGVITIHDILRIALTDREFIFDTTLTRRMLETDEKIY